MTVIEIPVMPRMCVLYRDTIDEAGNAVGWEPVAWAVVLPGGAAVTIPVHGAPAATLWQDITDARSELDADVVDEVRPRTGRALARDLEGRR
jgi:hypothetical protein